MTTEGVYRSRTIQAQATITPDMLFKAITIGGTLAASPLLAAGIARSTAAPGQGIHCIIGGDVKLKVGTAVGTLGYPLTITTSGWFIANTTSGSATIGRAMQLANSGDMIQAYVDFEQLAAGAVS